MSSRPVGILYEPYHNALPTVDLWGKLYNIKYVRVQWVDLINNIRHRVLPLAYFRKLVQSNRGGISITKASLGLVCLQTAPGFSPTGEYLYVPDLDSLRICPYAPGHLSVMGWFEEKLPSPSGGLSVPLCPRTLLKRIIDEAKLASGLSFLVGFESEFILLTAKGSSVNDYDWSRSAKLPTGKVETIVMEEIADAIQGGGVELQMYHGEAAPGQYEVVTGPLPPLEAADALIFTRETIYNIASKHNLRATFAPRVYDDSCGSGAHAHISLHTSRELTFDSNSTDPSANFAPTMPLYAQAWLQSVLTHLPALCALTLPIAHSYARVADGAWSGGTYAVWGIDNREVPVRLCGTPGNHNFEFRALDGTANPYIALAGVLGVGARGVREGARLVSGNCTVPVALMNDAEKARLGVQYAGRLPRTISSSRELLKTDEILGAVLGREFMEPYLAVNQILEGCLHVKNQDLVPGARRLWEVTDFY